MGETYELCQKYRKKVIFYTCRCKCFSFPIVKIIIIIIMDRQVNAWWYGSDGMKYLLDLTLAPLPEQFRKSFIAQNLRQ